MNVEEALAEAARLHADTDAAEAAAERAAENQSHDEFWAEVEAQEETETILGVRVRVPSPRTVTLRTKRRIERLDLVEVSDEEIAAALDDLFGEGSFQRWYDAGMTYQRLAVVMAWGIARAGGSPITWRDAYEAVTTGKAPERLLREKALRAKGASSGASESTGGRSKAGRSRKGSKRKRSRT
ncbi:hypothetical protein ACOQFV_27300 [Nocardiopsis changdeensis]|uniref:Tail assembly chaperone n=1 Tax=Nocardiopsis changdeensis TaxID=2831969 RepID=A0ABX8BMQ2_9ACTN|nr:MULTISPECIES: hypothetical protein [Nocardiopsis]QUX22975.1 hypothetical protein KGD84_00760 [Nocardiopsis changdeensis]QYX38918.1 hypothetical protein K1J57_10210 [Nocardiopsis sp. MT53]